MRCVRCGVYWLGPEPPPRECPICGGVLWISVRFSRRSGGDWEQALLLPFSATFSGGSRDNRGMSLVMVQKGGERYA